MNMENVELPARKLLHLLREMAEYCEKQIQCIQAGELQFLETVNREKDQLIQQMVHVSGEFKENSAGFADSREQIQKAFDSYMAMEAGVQKALSARSGEVADQMIAHYKARVGHEGYEHVANLSTPIARLFADSSRYIDKRG